MNKLKSHLVSEPWQVELMRHIYNDNLDMLSTKPLPYRSYDEQQKWWEESKHFLNAYLYEPIEKPGKFVAFLVLRQRNGFMTPTIAIQKEDWGSGYGQEIVLDYINKANCPLAGTQLQSNKAICHINKKVGWQVIGEQEQAPIGKIDLLFHPGINPKYDFDEEIISNILSYLEINASDFNIDKIKYIRI